MKYLKIAKWDKWQTYRSDRSQPPWIKLHRSLLRNVDWAGLTDAQKGQLASIWMLAADRGGRVPDCPETIRKFTGISGKLDLQVFIDLGFIEKRRQPDANTTPTRQPVDSQVTHQTRLEETRLDGARRRDCANLVLKYLNTCIGSKLTYIGDIDACLKREGCTLDDCMMVIDDKVAEWRGDPKMEGFLKKGTMWQASKFQSYLSIAKSNGSKPKYEGQSYA